MDQKLIETIIGAGAVAVSAGAVLGLVFGVVTWIRALAAERIALAVERKLTAERETEAARVRREETNQLLTALTDHVHDGQEITRQLMGVLQSNAGALGATEKALKELSGMQTLAIAETNDGIRKTREHIDGVNENVKAIVPNSNNLAGQILERIDNSRIETVQEYVKQTRIILDALDGMRQVSEDQNQRATTAHQEAHARLVEAVEQAKRAIQNAVLEAYKSTIPQTQPSINTVTLNVEPLKMSDGNGTEE